MGSSLLRAGLTLVVAGVLSLLLAPAVHLVAPTDSWIDLAAAQSLDTFDAISENLMGGGPVDITSKWLSDSLRRTGLTVFNPSGWHGPQSWTTSGSSDSGFFEGWYYKCVTTAGRTVVLIPGGIYGSGGNKTFAFVILADPSAERPEDRVQLFEYPIDELVSTKGPNGQWSVRVGQSVFSPDAVSVRLLDPVTNASVVHGDIRLENSIRWPASILLPDVMGWFAWLPGMECRHGVVSLDSDVVGEMKIRGKAVGFTGGGKAYVEKDWGSAFPRTWLWCQSNHFICDEETPGPWCQQSATLLLSIASIPFPSNEVEIFRFRGFLGGLRVGDTLYRFATYSGAVIERFEATQRGAATVSIRTPQHRLEVWALGDMETAALLHGPTPGGRFEPFVHEMLGAELKVRLTRRSDGKVIFEAVGQHAGLEIESKEPGGLSLLK
eukprot:m.35011 g.35011  ORF g.35011 m.35011 type:complete len:437 (+) comp12733_c0_seq1:48-1358(+)